MSDLNIQILEGRLTRDPEIKTTGNGSLMAVINVANNKRYKKDEEWVEEPTFFRCVAWNRKAEIVRDRLVKGQRVYVLGESRKRKIGDSGQSSDILHEVKVHDIRPLELPRCESASNQEQPMVPQSQQSFQGQYSRGQQHDRSHRSYDNRPQRDRQPVGGGVRY